MLPPVTYASCMMQLVQWEFADATLSPPGDQFADTNKLRKAGFEGQVGSFLSSGLCPDPSYNSTLLSVVPAEFM